MKESLRPIECLGMLGLVLSLSCVTASAASSSSKEWVKLENCTLVPNESNDGDSFHVRSNDTEYLIRLYLVDAPEIEGIGASRLVEQASYFGVSVHAYGWRTWAKSHPEVPRLCADEEWRSWGASGL